MNTGVRQGCLLIPLLFVMALDWVSRQAFGDNKTGIQFTLLQKLKDVDFADDMVLLSQKITHTRQKFAALVEQVARVGLKINAFKTREMSIGLHIPRQPYHHHRRHLGRCWGQMQKGTEVLEKDKPTGI